MSDSTHGEHARDGAGSEDDRSLPSARVLVIDDEQSIRHFVSRSLADAGYEVATAGTGAEGLRLFRAEPADLVVLDLRLPDASGLDLLEQLKGEAPATPVPPEVLTEPVTVVAAALATPTKPALKMPAVMTDVSAADRRMERRVESDIGMGPPKQSERALER